MKFQSLKILLPVICLWIFDSCKKNDLPVPPQDGLIADIALNGDAFDRINLISGTILNAQPTSNRHGENGQAMYFTRHDSAFIDFGDAPEFSFPQNIFTISCWILANDTSSPSTIMSKRNATGPFEYSLDNHMNRQVFNFDNWVPDGSTTVYGKDPLNASAAFITGQWQHIAFVADGFLLKAYLNGQPTGVADTIKAGFAWSDTDAPFQIGVGGGYGRYYHFDGAIDDILIYNRVLTDDEIKLLAGL
jgi:hypothetical protein